MAKATDTTLKPGMVNLSTPAIAQNKRQGVVPNMTPIPAGMREAILAKATAQGASGGTTGTTAGMTGGATSGATETTAPAAVTQPSAITGQVQTSEQRRGLFPDVVSSLRTTAVTPRPELQEALREAADIAQRTAEIQQAGARGRAGFLTTGTTPVAQGGAAVIAQTQAAQEKALAEQQRAALERAGIAQKQQEIELGGLGQVAGFAAPSAQFPFVFDPVTGQFFDTSGGAGGAGGLNPLTQIEQIADQVIALQRSPSQAEALGGNIPNWRSLLNERIQAKQPGFDFGRAEGAFAAKQQATQIAGAAPTQTAAGLYEAASKQYQDLRGQVRNVDSLGELLLDVAGAGVINPVDLTIGNKTIAQVRRNLSAAEQVRFDSALATFSSAASQLLASQSGQIPTAISENIAKIANGTLSLPALTAMVQQAKREGDIKLATAASQVNAPASVLGAPQVQAPKIETSETRSTPQVTPRGLQYKIF